MNRKNFCLIWADVTCPYLYEQQFVGDAFLLRYLASLGVSDNDVSYVQSTMATATVGEYVRVDAAYGDTEMQNFVCNLIVLRIP